MPAQQNVARITLTLEVISAAALLVLMLVVFVDVLGRNLFNSPLPWGTELLEIVLAVMIFAVYPLLAHSFGHITVDLIQARPSLLVVQRLLASMMGAVVFALICFCMGRQAIRAAGYGEATPLLGVPLSLIIGGVSVMAAITSLASLLAIARSRYADHLKPFSTEVI